MCKLSGFRVLGLLLLFVLLFTGANAQWVLKDSASYTPYALDVHSSGKIIVSGNDTSSISQNFGGSWIKSPISLSTAVPFVIYGMNDLVMLDNQTIVGVVQDIVNRQTIVKSTDGGATWRIVKDSLIPSATLSWLTAICFPTRQVGYCVSAHNHIYKTTDEGEHWTQVYSAGNYIFRDVDFISVDTGLAIGSTGRVYTTNGGVTWKTTSATATNSQCVSFLPSVSQGYITTDDNITRISSRNVGSLFTSIPGSLSIKDVWVSSRDTAYFLSGNRVYRTVDGASNWEYTTIPSATSLIRIRFISPDSGVLVSQNGKIYTTVNSGGAYKPRCVFSLSNTNFCTADLQSFNISGSAKWKYQWLLDGVLIADSQNIKYRFTTPGTHVLTAIGSNGTLGDTTTKTIQVAAKGEVTPFTLRLAYDTICSNIYPDVKDTLYASTVQSGATYKVYLNGTLVSNSLPYTFMPGIQASQVYMVIATAGNSICGYVSDTVYKPMFIYPAPGGGHISVNKKMLHDTICYNSPLEVILTNTWPNYRYRFTYFINTNYTDSTAYQQGNGDTLFYKLPFQMPNYGYYFYYVSDFGCKYSVSSQFQYKVKGSATTADFSTFTNYGYGDTLSITNSSQGINWQWSASPGLSVKTPLDSVPVIVVGNITGPQTVNLISNIGGVCPDTATQDIYVSKPAAPLSVSNCYSTAVLTPGTDSIMRTVLDQHIGQDGALYTAGMFFINERAYNYTNHFGLFISKTDSAGKIQWEKKAVPYSRTDSVYTGQGRYYTFSAINGVTTDPAGNVYISGSYAGMPFYIDTVSFTQTEITQSRIQGFAAKFNKYGRCLWIISTQNINDYNSSSLNTRTTAFSDIEYWHTDKILLGSKNTSSVLFKNGVFEFTGLALIDTNGNFVRQYYLADGPNEFLYSVVTSNIDLGYNYGELYCTYPKLLKQGANMHVYGLFTSISDSITTISQSLNLPHETYDSAINCGLFVAKLAPSGWLSLKELGSSNRLDGGQTMENSLVMDAVGNYYMVQNYARYGPFRFNTQVVYTGSGHYDTIITRSYFITKFDANGNRVWSKKVPGGTNETVVSNLQLAMANNQLYVYCTFYDNFPGFESSGVVSEVMHTRDYPIKAKYTFLNAGLFSMDLDGNISGGYNVGRVRRGGLIKASECGNALYLSAIDLHTLPQQPDIGYVDNDYVLSAEKISLTGSCTPGNCPVQLSVLSNSFATCSDTVTIPYDNFIVASTGISSVSVQYQTNSVVKVDTPTRQISYVRITPSLLHDTLTLQVCDTRDTCRTGQFYFNFHKVPATYLSDSTCKEVPYKFGDDNLLTAGTYSHNYTSIHGCDSLVVLNLKVTSPNSEFRLQGTNTLVAVNVSDVYTWIDCNTQQVVGNNAEYTATVSSSYALVSTINSCADTSGCMEVLVTGVEELLPTAFLVAPNPFSTALFISTTFTHAFDIHVYDLSGRQVMEQHSVQKNATLNVSSLAPGAYFVELVANGNSYRQRVVKP